MEYFLWAFSITGVVGGLFFLSTSTESQTIAKHPLEKKGIFNPIYKLCLTIIFLVADFVLKLCCCVWTKSCMDNLDEATVAFLLSIISVGALLCLMYQLCLRLMPDVNVRNFKKTGINLNYRGLGIFVFILFSLEAVASYYLLINTAWYDGETASTFFTIIVVVFAFGACCRAYQIMSRLGRIADDSERTLMSLKTKRAPIIFLRSFELDKLPLGGYTFDEYICRKFSQTSQPILSLSDPEDFLPTGGSIKIQSRDQSWKPAIIELFSNCRAVVIFEGRSDGLRWEIENLKKYIPHDKLFVATPPKRYRRAAWCSKTKATGKEAKQILDYIWFSFSSHLGDEEINLPATNPGSDVIFAFDSGWNCIKLGENKRGKQLFDTILDKTTKYKNTSCDYPELSQRLDRFVLKEQMSPSDIKKIKKGLVKIAAVVAVIITIVSYLTLTNTSGSIFSERRLLFSL